MRTEPGCEGEGRVNNSRRRGGTTLVKKQMKAQLEGTVELKTAQKS